ncbi:MAG: hypothetical protein FWB88_06365 [Defluviitaleaceae bacterium]|nr:hypothetical protein [Defluviitaleaceae bacterium]MCL2239159.1 hypothetical protein [Defluviitaleaceae bacterium]
MKRLFMGKWVRKALVMLLTVVLVFALVPPVAVNALSREELLGMISVQLTMGNIAEAERLTDILNSLFPVVPPPPPPPSAPQVFAPNIRLISPQTVTLEPGETRDVPLTIRNTGVGTASEVVTSVSSTGPFIIDIISNARIASMAQNNERTLTLRITASADAEPGNAPGIALRHDFRTGAPGTGSTENTLAVHIGGVGAAPNIQLTNFRGLDAPVEPGQSFTVTADITNTGQGTAQNLQVTFPGLNANHAVLISDLNQALVPTLSQGQTHTLSFTFQAASGVPRGTLPLEFEVAFSTEGGQRRDTRFTRFINVVPYGADAPLVIRDITGPTGRFEPGQNARFALELYNAGDVTVTGIIATAVPPAAIAPMSQTTVVLNSLAPGTSTWVEFSFTPRDTAFTEVYTIEFSVDFNVNGASAEPVPQFAALHVYNPSAARDDYDMTDRPWLIVENFTVNPTIAQAGQEFTMNITFRNTSPIHSVHSTRIIFTPQGVGPQGDIVFIPVGGSSNTLFVDYIPPGGTVDKVMTFFTVGDAMPRSYTMRITMDYQSPGFRANALGEYVDLAIRVAQFVRLDIVQDFMMPSVVNVGDPIRMDFQVINSGRVTLHNVHLRVEEHNRDPNFPLLDTTQANLPIGDMGPSRWLMYNGMFVPLVPGFITGDIIIYGDDPAFELVEHRIPFEIYVMDPWGGGGDWSGFGDDPWEGGYFGDPFWPEDPFWPGDPGFHGGPWEEEEPGFWRRVWRWLTTPLGGYAGHRRDNGQQEQDMFFHGEFWGDAGYENGGFELTRQVIITPGGGGMVVSPGGGSVVVSPGGGRPMSPGMGMGGDMFGWEEPEPLSDPFFINLWNFVRMPIFLFPFGLMLGAGITLLVIRMKRRTAEMMDMDE